jgi:hypothetical protein
MALIFTMLMTRSKQIMLPDGVAAGAAGSRASDDSAARQRGRVAPDAIRPQDVIPMTTKAAFTDDEWKTVLNGPTDAGMMVVTASRGGTFRETFAMSKAYVEAREHHGQSELLDEIVSTRPKSDHPKGHSPEEAREYLSGRIRDAVALVAAKATPQELEDYRNFILTLANKVAAAHREDGQDVSPAEAQAIDDVTAALGAG